LWVGNEPRDRFRCVANLMEKERHEQPPKQTFRG
jgi:hypothetical protein